MPNMDGPTFASELRKYLDSYAQELNGSLDSNATEFTDIVQPYICCCTAYSSDTFLDSAF